MNIDKETVEDLISICNQADTLWMYRKMNLHGVDPRDIFLNSNYTERECNDFQWMIEELKDRLLNILDSYEQESQRH